VEVEVVEMMSRFFQSNYFTLRYNLPGNGCRLGRFLKKETRFGESLTGRQVRQKA
jgi:hypothetical protein